MLPMYIEAITPQNRLGCSDQQQRPRLNPVDHQGHEDHGDRRIAGDPQRQQRDEGGLRRRRCWPTPGPRTPSMAPLPNSSGCLEIFFSTA